MLWLGEVEVVGYEEEAGSDIRLYPQNVESCDLGFKPAILEDVTPNQGCDDSDINHLDEYEDCEEEMECLRLVEERHRCNLIK